MRGDDRPARHTCAFERAARRPQATRGTTTRPPTPLIEPTRQVVGEVENRPNQPHRARRRRQPRPAAPARRGGAGRCDVRSDGTSWSGQGPSDGVLVDTPGSAGPRTPQGGAIQRRARVTAAASESAWNRSRVGHRGQRRAPAGRLRWGLDELEGRPAGVADIAVSPSSGGRGSPSPVYYTGSSSGPRGYGTTSRDTSCTTCRARGCFSTWVGADADMDAAVDSFRRGRSNMERTW
jgi:hypothetical protein